MDNARYFEIICLILEGPSGIYHLRMRRDVTLAQFPAQKCGLPPHVWEAWRLQ